MDKEHGSLSALLKRRILSTSRYSWQGLVAAFRHEEAFRVEVLLALLFLPLAPFIAENSTELVMLFAAAIQVLIVELLNSAVESTVDRIGDEHHELAGRAKDMGSAAVMLSLGLFFLIWIGLAVS